MTNAIDIAPPTLEEIIAPALATLRSGYGKYLRTQDPEKVALDITRNPFRIIGLQERDLAQHRLVTVRASKIGVTLESCAILLASRHQGCTVHLDGPASIGFTLERPHDRIVFLVQSRARTENAGTQALASQMQLRSRKGEDKPTHLVRCYVAEPGIDSEYELRGDVHEVQGALTFHWLSGDPRCWHRIHDLIRDVLRDQAIRIAELDFAYAVQVALTRLEGTRITEAQYLASRFDLEQALGTCSPVLQHQPPAEVQPDVFDLISDLDRNEDE